MTFLLAALCAVLALGRGGDGSNGPAPLWWAMTAGFVAIGVFG